MPELTLNYPASEQIAVNPAAWSQNDYSAFPTDVSVSCMYYVYAISLLFLKYNTESECVKQVGRSITGWLEGAEVEEKNRMF